MALAAEEGTVARSAAPTNAPTEPAPASRAVTRVSTLPKEWWARPEINVVKSWARCTDADAAAARGRVRRHSNGLLPCAGGTCVQGRSLLFGVRPAATRTVEEVTP